MQAYELNKNGLRVSDSLCAMSMKFIITQLALVLFTFIIMIFEFDFLLHDGVVIENEKADKEGRKKRMSAMCVKVREQTNMNRKEFAEWLGIPYRTMQDWERGVSEVPDYVLNLIAYKVKNEKEKGNI